MKLRCTPAIHRTLSVWLLLASLGFCYARSAQAQSPNAQADEDAQKEASDTPQQEDAASEPVATPDAGATEAQQLSPDSTEGADQIHSDSAPPLAQSETELAPSAEAEVTPVSPASVEPPEPAAPSIEVVARGNSRAARLTESARAVQVIDLERDRARSADLGEILARSSGLSIRRSGGLGSETRLMLNGLSDDQVRVFMDGVPLHLAGYPFGLSNIPVGLIDHVAVYRGVVPVALGADALGGAIDIITQEDLRKNKAELSYQTGSFGTHRLLAQTTGYLPQYKLYGRASAFFDHSDNDYLINVMVADNDGVERQQKVRRFHGAYQAFGAHVEAGVLGHSWAQKLRVRAFYTDNDSELQHAPNMRIKYGEVTFGKRSFGALAQYNQKFFKNSRLDATAGYTQIQTSFRDMAACAYDWHGRCLRELSQLGEMSRGEAFDQSLTQHNVYARTNWLWTLHADHKVRFALAPTYTQQQGRNHYRDAEIDTMRSDRALLSGIAGVEYESSWFDGRLENIAFGKGYLLQLSAHELLPSLEWRQYDRTTKRLGAGDSMRVKLSEAIYAKASYEYATRLPNPEEVFGDGILTIATLDLKPEKSHNINLGVAVENRRTKFGDVRLGVHGFARSVDDLILKLGALYYEYKNVMSARILGVESNAGWTSPGEWVSIDGNMTLQDPRNQAEHGPHAAYKGNRLPHRPYALANGSVRLKAKNVSAPGDSLELMWDTRYVHEYNRDWGSLATDNTIPSQLTHALALVHTLRGDPLAATFTLEALNLTNAKVYDFFGTQRPGRSVFFKMTFTL